MTLLGNGFACVSLSAALLLGQIGFRQGIDQFDVSRWTIKTPTQWTLYRKGDNQALKSVEVTLFGLQLSRKDKHSKKALVHSFEFLAHGRRLVASVQSASKTKTAQLYVSDDKLGFIEVSEWMLSNGFADISNDGKRAPNLVAAIRSARQKHLGIWRRKQ